MASSPLCAQRRFARALQAGGPEVLEVAVEELRPLQPGEVLVRVQAAGLNHVDSLARSGGNATALFRMQPERKEVSAPELG